MLLDTPCAELSLDHNQLAHLDQACGTRVDCVDGVAWITIDGDTRDIVLQRGESFVIDRARPVIVHAIQGPASVALHAHAAPSRCREPRRGRTPRWRQWWRGMAQPAAGAV